jgi:GTP-binding protein Era
VTDQPERFFIGEIVREQVLQLTHDELPFSTAVIVDRIENRGDGITNIYCTILVDRESQKPIVVGRAGSMIKQIGTAARAELERYLERACISGPYTSSEIRVEGRRAVCSTRLVFAATAGLQR